MGRALLWEKGRVDRLLVVGADPQLFSLFCLVEGIERVTRRAMKNFTIRGHLFFDVLSSYNLLTVP